MNKLKLLRPSFCSAAAKAASSSPSAVNDVCGDLTLSVKPFTAIPGPKSLPGIGTLHNYLPFIGKYSFDRLHHNGKSKLNEFGSLVKEEIIPGVFVVWVFTVEDIETVYASEGQHPLRRSHLILEKYRKDNPHIYNSGGLLPTNGLKWMELRKGFQKGLSRVQDVRLFLPEINSIMQDFIELRLKSQSHHDDFLPDLSRLFLELTVSISFGERLNSFSLEEKDPSSKSSRLIDAAFTVNSCILKSDNGPQLWKRFRTPIYQKFEAAHSYLEKVGCELIEKKEKELKKKSSDDSVEKLSLVEQYLRAISSPSSKLDIKDVNGIGIDFLLAGIDTSSYTSSFALYHLAKNRESQDLVHKEVKKLMNNHNSDGTITAEMLKNASYTKAVVKEVLRMNPISVGIGRILAKDAVLSNYFVPKGTTVVTQNQVSCRLPEYFKNPEEFRPERWLKTSPLYQPVSPYLVLPFGHGPRACIARRLVEQELCVLIMKVMKDFQIEWNGKETLDSKSYLINKPDGPISLSFLSRT
ncbi:unnamed protein product [Bemisia tabaci]|uniref:Cytochrome P450 n=1 Tax=Bemisia tabaci TaxID=7038 RepID=A0A9P0EYE5_BEMTA|nr:unnamed protein product [Bemisia tabaci]